MIFFCIVLLSALSKEDAQVHPQSDHSESRVSVTCVRHVCLSRDSIVPFLVCSCTQGPSK